MRFQSHALRCKYVVSGYPRRRVMDPTNGSVTPYPGLEARFMNHAFDSENAQRNLGWTNDQRKTVENYLLRHADFDRPGGFYLEVTDGERKSDVIAEGLIPAKAGTTRCTAWFRNEKNESELCPNEATIGDLCVQHAPADIVDDQGGAEDDAPEPVAAPAPVQHRSFTMPLVGVK